MFTKRSRMDIIYSLLKTVKICNPGALPTHVMYKGNLSYELFKNYLGILLKNELIRAKTINKKTVYNITDKGEGFVRTYDRIIDILGGQLAS